MKRCVSAPVCRPGDLHQRLYWLPTACRCHFGPTRGVRRRRAVAHHASAASVISRSLLPVGRTSHCPLVAAQRPPREPIPGRPSTLKALHPQSCVQPGRLRPNVRQWTAIADDMEFLPYRGRDRSAKTTPRDVCIRSSRKPTAWLIAAANRCLTYKTFSVKLERNLFGNRPVASQSPSRTGRSRIDPTLLLNPPGRAPFFSGSFTILRFLSP